VDVYSAWLYILDYFKIKKSNPDSYWFDFKRDLDRTGWNNRSLRNFGDCLKPYIKISLPYKHDQSGSKESLCLGDLIRREVSFPDLPRECDIPNEWTRQVVMTLRKNLEIAVELQKEVSSRGLYMNFSITSEIGEGKDFSRGYGVSAWVLFFIRNFNRLTEIDIVAAQEEVFLWPVDDKTVFSRLRMWVIGNAEVVPNCKVYPILNVIPIEAFWDGYHQRDLLLSLSKRWNDFDSIQKSEIERKILGGPPKWKDEKETSYIERKSRSILERLTWLDQQGCVLELNLSKLTKKLSLNISEWKTEYAESAARSYGTKTGIVSIDSDCSELINIPIKDILIKSKELSGRRSGFIESDAFLGLSRERPIKSFSALRQSAKKGEVPEWAWSTFLRSDIRGNDKEKLTILISSTLLSFSDDQIVKIIHPLCRWLEESSETLSNRSYDIYVKLTLKIIGVVELNPSKISSSIVRGDSRPDWAMEAINSPIGCIVKIIFDDPIKDKLKGGQGFPETWLNLIERLLLLPGDLCRYVMTMISRNISWFYYIDECWTKKHILSVLDSSDKEDAEALWAGVLHGAGLEGKELFLELKPYLIQLAGFDNLDRLGHLEPVVGLIFSAWKIKDDDSSEKWVSDSELRDILVFSNDDFRCRLLWQAQNGEEDDWLPYFEELLLSVWPRQIVAKSVAVSERLCEIALWSESKFAEIVKLILPIVTRLDKNTHLYFERNDLAKKHPDELLSLLMSILPNDVHMWPYGFGEVLLDIKGTNLGISKDTRFVELQRKWDSR
ncbi:hypothetical protein L4C40_16310, partial [Enterovibrio baiacu]